MNRIAYRKVYKVRPFGVGGYEITIPRIVLERAAGSKGLTLEEFVKTHQVVHLFNSFASFDAAYRFEPIKETDQEVLEINEEELEELAPTPKNTQPCSEPCKTDAFNQLRRKLGGKQ